MSASGPRRSPRHASSSPASGGLQEARSRRSLSNKQKPAQKDTASKEAQSSAQASRKRTRIEGPPEKKKRGKVSESKEYSDSEDDAPEDDEPEEARPYNSQEEDSETPNEADEAGFDEVNTERSSRLQPRKSSRTRETTIEDEHDEDGEDKEDKKPLGEITGVNLSWRGKMHVVRSYGSGPYPSQIHYLCEETHKLNSLPSGTENFTSLKYGSMERDPARREEKKKLRGERPLETGEVQPEDIKGPIAIFWRTKKGFKPYTDIWQLHPKNPNRPAVWITSRYDSNLDKRPYSDTYSTWRRVKGLSSYEGRKQIYCLAYCAWERFKGKRAIDKPLKALEEFFEKYSDDDLIKIQDNTPSRPSPSLQPRRTRGQSPGSERLMSLARILEGLPPAQREAMIQRWTSDANIAHRQSVGED